MTPGRAGAAATNATTILLEPLPPGDAAELLDGLAGQAHLPEAAVERIVVAAEGNPLFLEELLATLVEEGRLRLEGDGYTVSGDLDAGPPPSVQALLAARLDRLEPQDRAILERAAVIGQEFEPDMVAELTEPAERAAIGSRLAGLARREFVRLDTDRTATQAGYRFRHLFVRDAVYDAMPKLVRAELHERVAGLVEARFGARVREYEEIVGYHLEQATRRWASSAPPCRPGWRSGPSPGSPPSAAAPSTAVTWPPPAPCSTGRPPSPPQTATCSTTWSRAWSAPASSSAPARCVTAAEAARATTRACAPGGGQPAGDAAARSAGRPAGPPRLGRPRLPGPGPGQPRRPGQPGRGRARGGLRRGAGDDPVDPELLLTLTEAVAAAFDPHLGGG